MHRAKLVVVVAGERRRRRRVEHELAVAAKPVKLAEKLVLEILVNAGQQLDAVCVQLLGRLTAHFAVILGQVGRVVRVEQLGDYFFHQRLDNFGLFRVDGYVVEADVGVYAEQTGGHCALFLAAGIDYLDDVVALLDSLHNGGALTDALAPKAHQVVVFVRRHRRLTVATGAAAAVGARLLVLDGAFGGVVRAHVHLGLHLFAERQVGVQLFAKRLVVLLRVVKVDLVDGAAVRSLAQLYVVLGDQFGAGRGRAGLVLSWPLHLRLVFIAAEYVGRLGAYVLRMFADLFGKCFVHFFEYVEQIELVLFARVLGQTVFGETLGGLGVDAAFHLGLGRDGRRGRPLDRPRLHALRPVLFRIQRYDHFDRLFLVVVVVLVDEDDARVAARRARVGLFGLFVLFAAFGVQKIVEHGFVAEKSGALGAYGGGGRFAVVGRAVLAAGPLKVFGERVCVVERPLERAPRLHRLLGGVLAGGHGRLVLHGPGARQVVNVLADHVLGEQSVVFEQRRLKGLFGEYVLEERRKPMVPSSGFFGLRVVRAQLVVFAGFGGVLWLAVFARLFVGWASGGGGVAPLWSAWGRMAAPLRVARVRRRRRTKVLRVFAGMERVECGQAFYGRLF
ncbi:hypothetical protein BpHYR1_037274 [Brachionus plicatilis]|uniref:Uncharacterized protein n=1 Tax=Brachionus plicatilis TaxID=10195 RepID=A0A3M7QLY2_BRAPC|nr:hypothetical protein BpHYR1_037274 [Brachionus plicatilis]